MDTVKPASAYMLLLDLLHVQDVDKYKYIADMIEKNPDKKIICFHRNALIFDAYYSLLYENMLIEDFLAVGDITSTQKISVHTNTISSIDWVQSMVDKKNKTDSKTQTVLKNSIYIVDTIALQYAYSYDESFAKISQNLKQYNSLLIDA